jgi:diadenosine tetraphosphate (Ap4A) HIT family hydrolase
MNATLRKFGYPTTVLKEFDHWVIMRRPAQVTLGSLILAAKHDVTAFGELPVAAFAELKSCTHDLEHALTIFKPYDKINYLALMMVDPHVHFHVLPRYARKQTFEGVIFSDKGWPGTPELKQSPELSDNIANLLHTSLLDAFRQVV